MSFFLILRNKYSSTASNFGRGRMLSYEIPYSVTGKFVPSVLSDAMAAMSSWEAELTTRSVKPCYAAAAAVQLLLLLRWNSQSR